MGLIYSFSVSSLSLLYIKNYILPKVPMGIIFLHSKADFRPKKLYTHMSNCQVFSLRRVGMGIAAGEVMAQKYYVKESFPPSGIRYRL